MKLNRFKIIVLLFVLTMHIYGASSSSYSYDDVKVDGLVLKVVGSSMYGDAWFGLYSASNNTDIIIPDSVTAKVTHVTSINGNAHTDIYYRKFPVCRIYAEAFQDCKDLKKITIPSTITTIDPGAFADCPNLEDITLDGLNKNYYLKGEALYESSNYIHTIIPKKAEETFFMADSIKGYHKTAFANCLISSIIVDEGNDNYFAEDGILCYKSDSTISLIPPGRSGTLSLPMIKKTNYRISPDALYETSLDQIIIWESPYYGRYEKSFAFLETFPKDKKVYAINSAHNKIKNVWTGTIQNLTELFPLKEIKRTLSSFEFSISQSDDIDIDVEELSLVLKYSDTDVVKKGGNYFINGLNPGCYYTLAASFEEDGLVRSLDYSFQSKPPYTNLTLSSSTQTSLTFSCLAYGDETISCEEYGVCIDGTYIKADEENRVCITGLLPNTTYSIYLYARYENGYVYKEDPSSFKTKAINLDIQGTAFPTSISCIGIFEAGDAAIEECGFNSENVEGEELLLTGLEPSTEYSITFFIRTKEGYSTSVEKTFITPALDLTTQQPKGVSASCSIVSATTNISDDETNVGFQWKKYDAPESLAPSEGYAAIYDGQLEGYIKNLQPTSYYNVRAFYRSATGNYYYGEWVTFDPSDFSYFEPTVHTYEATEIGSSSAKVKGYVLAGTDDIIEQGFEYWVIGAVESNTMCVKAVAEYSMSTVFGTGQVMTANLTDLQPGSTYCFRTFVRTVSSITYGEEQIFTTDVATNGIGNVETEAICPVVIGYYDLGGRKYDEPQRGLNIIRYSDGSARKVFMK